MSERDTRILDHPVLGPAKLGPRVAFELDGRTRYGREGEPVAVALLATGRRVLRRSERSGRPRGLYCAIGHCFECRMTIDGRRNVRGCLVPLREGMVVETRPGPAASAGPTVGDGEGGTSR
jgi:sarcosine oxidase subunit alpha